MDKVYIMGGVVLLTIVLIILWGDHNLKKKHKILENITFEEDNNSEFISYLAYHGGYPAMPKPQKINLALSSNYLLLYNNQGLNGKISFNDCLKIDKFVTKKNPDLKGKSIVLWGPFMGIFLKPKIRFFITINYRDVNGRNNNILLETGNNKELEDVYNKIRATLYST